MMQSQYTHIYIFVVVEGNQFYFLTNEKSNSFNYCVKNFWCDVSRPSGRGKIKKL
jgi:hypothetical protein